MRNVFLLFMVLLCLGVGLVSAANDNALAVGGSAAITYKDSETNETVAVGNNVAVTEEANDTNDNALAVGNNTAVTEKEKENENDDNNLGPSAVAGGHRIKERNGEKVVEVDVSSDSAVVISQDAVEVSDEGVSGHGQGAVVEIKKKEHTVEISSAKSGPVVISVSTPSGVVVSVTAGESVEVKKGEIYLVNMTKPVEVLPDEVIAPAAVESGLITAELTSEGEKYKYKITATDGMYTSTEPVIAVHGSYKVVLPQDEMIAYVNDTIMEYPTIDAPIQVEVREKEQVREMLVKQKGNHSLITDGQVEATVTAEIDVENGEMSVDGKKVKMLPATASARAFEVTGAVVKDMELKSIENRAVYKMNLNKEYKFLWLVPVNVVVPTMVDAEDGTVISIEHPWWAFLSSNAIQLKEGASIQ